MRLRKSLLIIFALLATIIGGGAVIGGLGDSVAIRAQDVRYFRIGTASVSGTYYSVGEVLASLISQPPGTQDCDTSGSCEILGLVGIAQVSEGSLDNLEAVNTGKIESGLAQADLSDWAVRGVMLFDNEERMRNIRSIATLYRESFHLVATRTSGVASVADLKGKRVSLDRIGSGTHAEAVLLLEAFGIGIEDIIMVQETPGRAAEMMLAGQIDAMFFVGGYPVKPVSELAFSGKVVLVPITGVPVDKLLQENRFLSAEVIPADAYSPSFGDTQSLAVGAQWIVNSAVDEKTVYWITKALWDKSNQDALLKALPLGGRIRAETAVQSGAVPLHPGALRYYREAGLLPGSKPAAGQQRPMRTVAGAPPLSRTAWQ